MLVSLRIKHFGVVDELAVELSPGFTVVTGETGAGKSTLVGAIALLLGERATSEVVKSGEDEACVEALFSLDGESRRAAEEAGVALEGDELVVKRIVSRSGKNRVFLNGGPATLGMLSTIGRRLIDIAGQHEHQSLLAPETQRALVDAAAGHGFLPEMREAWTAWRSAHQEAEALAAREADRARREDYLRFQVEELARAGLQPEEEDALHRERGLLQHAASLSEAVTAAEEMLYSSDGAVIERLKAVAQRLGQAARIDPGLAPLEAPLGQATLELEEVARALRDHRAPDADPARLTEIEDRLALIDRLRKKHGLPSVAELQQLQAKLEGELAELSSFEERLSALRAAEAKALESARAVAARLTKARRAAAKALASEVVEELRGLAMPHARFAVSIEPSDLSPSGSDALELLLSANPGEEPRSLSRVASGGELSRVMLALKRVLASHHPVSSYVFDEVDAGVGGAVAARVGKTLGEVARSGHQVLCITHLPQIAALGDAHLSVRKTVTAGRVRISIEELDAAGRQEELARMLAGEKVSGAAKAHAREMLAAAG